jgi:hypothetical protein
MSASHTARLEASTHHRVGVLRQAAHAQQAVVWLHDDVALLRVGEHAVRLYELLGEPVVESLEHEGAQTRAGTTSNRVQQHEALERVGAVGLAVDHVQDVLVHLLAHAVAHAPVVSGAGAILVDVEVLGVVDVLVCARLDRVEHARLEIEQNGAWNVSRVVGLVEEDVLAVAALGRKVLEVAVAVDAVLLAQLLPELLPDAVAALARLQCYYFSGEDISAGTPARPAGQRAYLGMVEWLRRGWWWDVDAFGGVWSATCPNYSPRRPRHCSLRPVPTTTTHHAVLARENVVESLLAAGKRCVFSLLPPQSSLGLLLQRRDDRFFDLPSRIPNMTQNRSV